MIKTNYQTYGNRFSLRLRIYLDGETKYVSVNNLLNGKLNKRHWNQRRQSFIPSAPFSKENNEALAAFKSKYDKLAIEWTGSLIGFMQYAKSGKLSNEESDKPTVANLLARIITDMKHRKHEDGTIKGSYEAYEKLEKRLKEFCQSKHYAYDKMLIEDMTSDFINSIFDWVESTGRGITYISKVLHSVLNKADGFGLYDMNELRGVRWAKKQSVSGNKYHTLTPAQCNTFIALKRSELPKNPKSSLYKDFCVFLLFTGQSPCDAIALKYSDIEVIDGVRHFVFKRRKISEKQTVPCAVPINPIMEKIMKRWELQAKDGYVFPIRSKHKIATQITNNGDIKHFVSRLNYWLKKIGDILGCSFPLHAYTFRHTAITNYISKNVPVIYVANMMGTSVENCEKIYYNNRGDSVSRDKVLNIASF